MVVRVSSFIFASQEGLAPISSSSVSALARNVVAVRASPATACRRAKRQRLNAIDGT